MSEKYKSYNITLQMADGKLHKIPIAVPIGKDGEDGHTPVKGKDYWTPQDKAEVKAYVAAAVLEYMPEVYVGEHTVIPAVSEQTLDTAKKMVQEDIVVEAIPYSEVTNATNGKTVTIG